MSLANIILRDSPYLLSSIRSWSDTDRGARTRKLSCTSGGERLRVTFIDQTERTFSLIRTIEPDGSSKPKYNYLGDNTRQPPFDVPFLHARTRSIRQSPFVYSKENLRLRATFKQKAIYHLEKKKKEKEKAYPPPRHNLRALIFFSCTR